MGTSDETLMDVYHCLACRENSKVKARNFKDPA